MSQHHCQWFTAAFLCCSFFSFLGCEKAEAHRNSLKTGENNKFLLKSLSNEQIETSQFLTNFWRSHKKMMNAPLVKHDLLGQVISHSWIEGINLNISTIVTKKNNVRKIIIAKSSSKPFVDEGSKIIDNLPEISKNQLNRSTLLERPWSRGKWPIRRGLIGFRYNDAHIPESPDMNLNKYKEYYDQNPASYYVLEGKLQRLSAAEKYDLLLEDNQLTLTKFMWKKGVNYLRNNKNVRTNKGIGLQSIPASYMVPAPIHAITIPSIRRKYMIKFYPTDIKALTEILWEHGKLQNKYRYLGNLYGKEKTLHAGLWHLTLINQIGVAQRSFIIDSALDGDLGHRAVHGYEVTYFNPKEGTLSADWKSGLIKLNNYNKDPFKSSRSAHCTFIIGVKLKLQYIIEVAPKNENDSQVNSSNGISEVTLYYDLELNNQLKIIGGKWYTNYAPDFIYNVDKNESAISYLDSQMIGKWTNAEIPMPQVWRSWGIEAALKGQLLAHIVNTLVLFSRQNINNKNNHI